MPLTVFALVLFSALLHAGWNTVVKLSGDKTGTALLVAVSAAAVAGIALPFLPQPVWAAAPFIAATACIHVVYYQLVARAYHSGDLGQTYPLMRGIAPLIIAFVGALFLGEPISEGGLLGVALISAGVLGIGLGSRRAQAGGIAYAVANAGIIAAYTLIDGFGARVSGAPVAYTLWGFVLTGIPLALMLALTRRRWLAECPPATLWRALAGGLATLVAYSLVVWAMTAASIPEVAALRETAILFGAAISVFVLKENARPIRVASACVIAAGAAAIRLQ